MRAIARYSSTASNEQLTINMHGGYKQLRIKG